MRYLSVMIKPASSLCNLNCKYCFYDELSNCRNEYSYGMMQETTANSIIKNIFHSKEKLYVSIVFQGGEPTLAGLEFFQKFVEKAEQEKGASKVEYALQTNGTLLDENWCEFLKENDFLVGLSLDMMANNHNRNRRTKMDEETYQKVIDAKNLLETYGVRYNVLTVLTNTLADYPDKVWKYMEKQNIEYIQFVPCLSMDETTESSLALTPERFSKFYSRLFELWSFDFEKGKYRSVKLFDDLIHLLADGSCNACGIIGRCSPQIVVEADGSAYPCDFYAVDEYKIGNLSEQNIEELLSGKITDDFISRKTAQLKICRDCRYMGICGGGCPKMRQEVCGKIDGNTCGYQMFLATSVKKLEKYAKNERTYLYKTTT